MADTKQGVEYEIGAKDTTGGAVSAATSKIKSFTAAVGRNLMNIKAGFDMLVSAARSATVALQKAFQFEKMTVQFKTLIGNMDEARAHMQMLKELGDTPPFSLEEFAAASRAMMVATDGVLGFKKSLELVGDAAAATGQPIQSLAQEVGRAFAVIRDGQPITRATMALRNMGVLTPEVAKRMQDLQDAGANTMQIWEELENALKRHNGAMEETEQTGDGLMGAIKSQWDTSVRELGEAFMETAKDGLGAILEKMKALNEDGSIVNWAERAIDALTRVADGAKTVLVPLGKALSFGWNTVKGQYESMAQGIGGFVGALAGGGGIGTAFKEGWSGFKQGWVDAFDADGAKADYNQRRKDDHAADIAEKRAYAEAEASRKAKEEELRKREKLAEGQRKIDARYAQEAAEEYEREYAKALERWLEEEERERQRVEREVAEERERLWREDLKNHQAALSAAQREDTGAQQRLAAAKAQVERAWGWYRNKDSLKAQIEEEKADAEAQRQYEKDFEKLKFRRDWREAKNLTLDQEAVRRVALAKEEEAAAQRAAVETADNTRRAAEALEKIETAFAEGGV